MKYIGIDGCNTGWFFIGLEGNGEGSFGIFKHIDELSAFLPNAEVALTDIPIGLRGQHREERLCDKQTRAVLAPRRSPSVFPAPSRCALKGATYAEASELNYECTGRKLSQQTYAIIPKIREVDDFLRSEPQRHKIREMHPEVGFWALNHRQAMYFPKKKIEGFDERMAILSRHLPGARKIVELAMAQYLRKEVARDDIVDALVGAVMARHPDSLQRFPEVPGFDDTGMIMEIVYWEP